jgi:prolyl-tRNA editing enzyme YbaK/EbsC (Cys-tRNA(Pro) deacylase)
LIKYKPTSSTSAFALLVMSAVQKIDNALVKKALDNPKSTTFANAEELSKITKCVPGAVPPFGSLF